jgi:hypothetical protein
MAKNNNEKNTKNNNQDPIPSATQTLSPKVSSPKPQEESHGGLIAAIVALVALIVIGSGVLAFVFLIKAKNKIDPITTPKPGTGEGLGIGATNLSGGGAGEIIPEVPIIPASTSPLTPTTPAPPVIPTTPDPPPVVPDTPDPPADEDEGDTEDQPVPVVYYNFDTQLSRMDTDMEGINPDKIDSGEFSNANVGL